jgi:hypothetical protein
MTRAIFLDFDGVLHPCGGPPGQTLPFEWLPDLAVLLAAAPDVLIAVHSSWCERYSHAALTEFLGSLGARMIGAVGPGARAAAILAFLRSHPEIDRWLVIDDDETEFPAGFPGTLAICSPARGVSDPVEKERIRQWLEDRP